VTRATTILRGGGTTLHAGLRASTIRVALLGFGTVGAGTYRMLQANRAAIESKIGAKLDIARIGIRDSEKPREAPRDLFTTDVESIVTDAHIDVVLELIGGSDPAYELIQKALERGKHVITANKELLAKRGHELMRIAASEGLDLHFEAAVGGGIPLIQALKHQLAGNDVLKMIGILNGTTNYILTQMSRSHMEYSQALDEAQSLGYAEADPANDVEGCDVRYKLAILASIAFGKAVSPEHVYCDGITNIETRDIELAHFFGYEIKLLGIVEPFGEDRLLARVHSAFVPKDHPLASVHGVNNALWIRGDFVGDLMFSGRGAGGDPTASAVVGDLIDVCRNMRLGGAANTIVPIHDARMLPIEDVVSRFYLRIIVDDKPSVLGAIATVLGQHDISLATMEMRVLDEERGEIVFMTHACSERDFRSAVLMIENLPIVRKVANWLHVESENTSTLQHSNILKP